MNLAEPFKKQTDAIFRRKQLNGTEGVSISGIITGTGAPPPIVSNPVIDLNKHKLSDDHDSRYFTKTELNAGQLDTRYYTKAEVDILVDEATFKLDLLTNGDRLDPQLLFDDNGDVIWLEVR